MAVLSGMLVTGALTERRYFGVTQLRDISSSVCRPNALVCVAAHASEKQCDTAPERKTKRDSSRAITREIAHRRLKTITVR